MYGVRNQRCSLYGKPEAKLPSLKVRASSTSQQTATKDAASASVSVIPGHAASNQAALEKLMASGDSRYVMEKKHSIIAIGLTIHDAPVELREKLAVPEPEWPRAIQELTRYPHIEEAAVLSTCNRMELYLVGLSWHRGVREAEEWMQQASGIPLEEMRPYLFLYRDNDAINHLLTVSAGLDSLVMGEAQILSQVKQVFKVGQGASGFGRYLNGLFNSAVVAGKRTRTETTICQGSVSVSSAAVELALLKLPIKSWSGIRVCIIGAGKMSTLLVKHLISKGCYRATIVNRSRGRVEDLQADFPDFQIDIKLMPDMMEACDASDVIFFASGSQELLVQKEDAAAMSTRGENVGGVRRFFDISVPRNVAQDISDLDNSHVYNVDDLKEVVAANKMARRKAANNAKVILAEELNSFNAWRDSLEAVPTIKALRQMAENTRVAQLEVALRKAGGEEAVSPKQRRAMEELSKSLINRLLHGPMTSLRATSDDPKAIQEVLQNMDALERMYDLQATALTGSTSNNRRQ